MLAASQKKKKRRKVLITKVNAKNDFISQQLELYNTNETQPRI